MQLIRSLIFNFYIYVSSIVLYGFVPFLLFGKKGAICGCNIWARNIIFAAKYILGIKYVVKGKVPQGPVIFASKHQSAWETAFFYMVRRDSVYVFKKELMYIPMFNLFLWEARHISLNRKGGASSLKRLIKDVKERLADGRAVVIFPEGRRMPVGSKPEYKAGIAALYANIDAPVVPVRLDSGKLWPRQSRIKKPGTITVEFLDPIPIGLTKQGFMTELEKRIEGK